MNITKEQVEALINCLRNGEQCDADGVMTKSFRQAAYEAADALSALAARGGEPVAWMMHYAPFPDGSPNWDLEIGPNKPAGDDWHPLYTHPKAEPGWQPIETAPKDGTPLLLGLFNARGKWRTMRGEWVTQEYIDDYWEEPEDAEPGWYETAVESEILWPISPTHWQPIPAAPQGDTNG